jgi:ubiquinone/menaquinone biosynthesis C-methylase UbiE
MRRPFRAPITTTTIIMNMNMNTTLISPARRVRRTERSRRLTTDVLWKEARASHRSQLERNVSHRRFGYDPVQAVRFVISKALPLTGKVLDVGTGKGRFAVALARQGVNLTSVDINPEEQHCAALEAIYAGVTEQIHFVVGDAVALPWPKASFDAVVTLNAIHHLADPCRAFSEMLRVLKPGGKLVLADFSPSGFQIMDEIHRADGKTHPHPPSHFAQWRVAVKLAGFAVRCFEGHHQEVMVAESACLASSPFVVTPPH